MATKVLINEQGEKFVIEFVEKESVLEVFVENDSLANIFVIHGWVEDTYGDVGVFARPEDRKRKMSNGTLLRYRLNHLGISLFTSALAVAHT